MNWLEVSLNVNGELAEAVADVLARYAPNGVVTEQGVKFMNEADQGTPAGPITVCAYLPMDDELEGRRRNIEEALDHLRMIQPFVAATFRPVADQNWMEAWKRHYRPIRIGNRLLVVPAWLDHRDPGRISMKIDPGMAFGTGTHPSTQLCLEFLEQVVAPLQRTKENRQDEIHVIDLGCGSGILSIAALKLGATAALGLDIDPEAIENARQNAKINGIGRQLELATGSLDDILIGSFFIRSARVVVVNILAPVIIQLFETRLADVVAPGGVLILSGILENQAPEVINKAAEKGFRLTEKRQFEDWVALLLAR